MNVLHVADLAEERHDRQPDEPPVVRHDRLHGEDVPSIEHDDHRLLGDGEIADHGDHADHERHLRRIGDERLLAVEQRHLGGLEDIRPIVSLRGLDQEVGLDVAEDGEAERGRRRVGDSSRGTSEWPPRSSLGWNWIDVGLEMVWPARSCC